MINNPSIPLDLGKTTKALLTSVQAQILHIANMMNKVDWAKLRKATHLSMRNEISRLGNERLTGIVSQTLAEYWFNQIIAKIFSNRIEIQKMHFSAKRQILHGLGLINPKYNNDLKQLNNIRVEYAHSFQFKQEVILKNIKKMNCYKKFKFYKNAKNNTKLKKCCLDIIDYLMSVEENLSSKKNMQRGKTRKSTIKRT